MLIHFTVTVQGPGAAEPRARRMAVRAGDVRELLETRDGNETYLERDNGEPVFVRAPFDEVFNLVNDAESIDVLEAAADESEATPDPLAPRCSLDPEGNHELSLVPPADNPDPDPTAPAKPLPEEVDVAHMLEGSAREIHARGVVEREKMESILAECRSIKADVVTLGAHAADAANKAQEHATAAGAFASRAERNADDCGAARASCVNLKDECQAAATSAKQANVASRGNELAAARNNNPGAGDGPGRQLDAARKVRG